MAGYLTTHVLDTARGCPAQGLRLSLYRLDSGNRLPLKDANTNEDGRVDAPIATGDEFRIGVYELEFAAGAYLKRHFPALEQPLFLDLITLRFGVSDAAAHYHEPLLLSSFGYSTYRGS